MKFSANKIIIIVVVVTIVSVLLYKYWYRTAEYFTLLTSDDLNKKALNYIGYSNIYMREINNATKLADLWALNDSHNALITKLFTINNFSWKRYGKKFTLHMLKMNDTDFEPLYHRDPYPTSWEMNKAKRLLGSALLRTRKITKMIYDKIEGM